MGKEPFELKKAITPLIAKKIIDTVNKPEKSQASNKKQIHPAAINMTKVNYQKNQGQLKEMKQETQLTKKINQGLFHQLIYLKKYKNRKTQRNRYQKIQFKSFWYVWTWEKCVK